MNRWAICKMKNIALCLSLYVLSIGFLSAEIIEEQKELDVRILIDISGSMKVNDPNNLRQPALELLIDLLPDNSKVGVWSFGTFVNMLVKPEKVDASWREQAKKQISNIHNLGQRTNLTQALKTSSYDFQFSSYQPGTHFILLTDGMVDVSRDPIKNQQARNDILQNVLPKFIDKQAVIHTVALSDQADSSLLQQLSIQTQGVADTAYVADDLTPIFLKAFDRLVSQEQVSLVENKFLIDKSVDEFTALIFHDIGEKIEFLSPNAQVIASDTSRNDVKWKRLPTYDIITIEQPKFGQWEIKGNVDALSRVSVISDLSLNMSEMANNIFSHQIPEFATWLTGEYITGNTSLEQNDDRIMDESLLSLLDVNVVVEQNGAPVFTQRLNKQMDEFVFDQEHLLNQGEYKLTLNLIAPTFERTIIKNIMLRSAFSVESLGISKPEAFYLIRVYKNDRNIVSNTIKVMGEVNGKQVAFEMTDHGYWEYKQFPDASNTPVKMTVMASYKRGVLQVTDEKIANLDLMFPVNASNPVLMSKPIEMAPETVEIKPSMMPVEQSKPQMDDSKMLSHPEIVLGFNKLAMPELDTSDQVVTPPMPKPMDETSDEGDEWGDIIEEPVTDDSLNLVTIALSTIPLLIVLGVGFWLFNKVSNQVEPTEDGDIDYSPEEQEALDALEAEQTQPKPLAEPVDIEIDDSELEKEFKKPEQAIDVTDEGLADIGVDLDADLDIEPELDVEAQLDVGADLDVGMDELDAQTDEFDIDAGEESELESEPIEDALDEFEKQTSGSDEFDIDVDDEEAFSATDNDSDPVLDELDAQIDELEENPFESELAENDSSESETIDDDPFEDALIEESDGVENPNEAFDIDVDSLDAGELDGMDFDQDDDPFESDRNPPPT